MNSDPKLRPNLDLLRGLFQTDPYEGFDYRSFSPDLQGFSDTSLLCEVLQLCPDRRGRADRYFADAV
jgi:hypothetical protein